MQTILVILVGELHHMDIAHFLLMVFDTINCGVLLHCLQNWMYCVTVVLLLRNWVVPINHERQSYFSAAPLWDTAEYLFLT